MFANQIYTKTARFDTGRPMTEDELRRAAPSIFARSAHESRSDRFQPIPTIDVLRGLQAEGFFPVGAKQSGSRDSSKRDFTKHMIRMRRFDNIESYKVGGTCCEVILKNANDGTSAYDLMAGLFRIQCLNSLVTQTATLDSAKVRHSGDALGKVIEATYTVLESAQKALAAPADWSVIPMPRDAQLALAEAAHVLRFADAEGNVDTPIQPAQLLSVRRADDRANDLWTQFNVVQENVIRGGLRGRHAATRENGVYIPARRMSTREVQGIDQDIKLNKALWVLGERMAQLMKQAA